jgi:hypothetical protein
MDTPHLLFGVTAINLMLAATAWTGARITPPQRDPRTIRAESIELVDARGQARIQLHLGEDGSGNLRVRDGSGQVRVKLGTTTEGSTGLLLMDQSIEPAVSLIAGKPGTSIVLAGPDGKRKAIAP